LSFERIGGEEIWKGHIGTVKVEKFRHDDGGVVQREVVEHPGAVVMLPFDGERIWLVRQPREAVGEDALLELPAGKLNGGEPLDTAKRELREEIGKSAATWQHLTSFYASPGFTNEKIHGPFEGEFVNKNIKFDAVKAAMRPYADCGACNINEMVGAYLVNTAKYVEPTYQLWKDGGLKDGDPRGVSFVTARISDGAAELRDLITDAWNASGKATVGYPAVSAADVEAGKAGDAYELLYGNH